MQMTRNWFGIGFVATLVGLIGCCIWISVPRLDPQLEQISTGISEYMAKHNLASVECTMTEDPVIPLVMSYETTDGTSGDERVGSSSDDFHWKVRVEADGQFFHVKSAGLDRSAVNAEDAANGIRSCTHYAAIYSERRIDAAKSAQTESSENMASWNDKHIEQIKARTTQSPNPVK